MDRPETTLFMLVSVDGKISTGDNDSMDVDKDYPKIDGVKEGLRQYYDIEQTTSLWSLNSGRVMAKIGVNANKEKPKKLPVNFIVIDDNHLTESGINFMAEKANKLFIVTTNQNHPAIKMKDVDNIEVISFRGKIDFADLFSKFKNDHNVDEMTVQTGGTLNSVFLREGLIDHLSIVLAPCLIGGKNTSTLIDGESLHSENELSKIKALKFTDCIKLKNNYLHLKYDVLNN